ncbi:MAG: DUF47 family protein [Nanoarchaeota archaeon]|nr:DUF47 family protein [Nanoarchaeota archaeon]
MGLKILPIFGREKEKDTLEYVKKFGDKLGQAEAVFRDCIKFWLDEDYERLAEYAEKVCKIENEADAINNEITLKMYSGAFLPGTRSHLHELIQSLDDIMDEIQNSVNIFCYMEDKKFKEDLKSAFWKLADETRKCIEKIVQIIEDLLEDKDDIMVHIKEAKQIEHNCDILKRDILDMVYFGKREAVTNILVAEIAKHIAGISDAVEAACQKIIVLKLLKQA